MRKGNFCWAINFRIQFNEGIFVRDLNCKFLGFTKGTWGYRGYAERIRGVWTGLGRVSPGVTVYEIDAN